MSIRKTPSDSILKKESKKFSGTDIARRYKVSRASVSRHLRRLGLNRESPIGKKGKEHSQWKGGRGIKSGYWCVYNPKHPRSMNNGRVWEHIILLEKALGRKISKGQPIHHIDFDRKNNKLKNLYLCENHSVHQKIHRSADECLTELFRRGLIGFSCGKYFIR